MIYQGLKEMLEAIEVKEARLREIDARIAKLNECYDPDFNTIAACEPLKKEYDKLDSEVATLKHDFVVFAQSEFEVYDL